MIFKVSRVKARPLELGFRQCHLVKEVAFEVQVEVPRFGRGGGSKVCGEGCFSTLTYFPERIISANNMIFIQYSRIQPETHNPNIYDA